MNIEIAYHCKKKWSFLLQDRHNIEAFDTTDQARRPVGATSTSQTFHIKSDSMSSACSGTRESHLIFQTGRIPSLLRDEKTGGCVRFGEASVSQS